MDDYLSEILPKLCDGPVYVHSDLRYVIESLGVDFRQVIHDPHSKDVILEKAIVQLENLAGERDLWLPAYNYEFCKTGFFDVENDPTQIGILPEFFRKNKASWRTATPVFSTCGNGKKPNVNKDSKIDPFGPGSEFDELLRRNGSFLFYGVAFSPTFTHYVERITDIGPLYRYDKNFSGIVKDGSVSKEVCLNYHVIPQGHRLKYDMSRLFQELIDRQYMKSLPPPYRNSYIIPARVLASFWKEQIEKDPFYLLDGPSRQLFEPLVLSKGGRLEIQDFENCM